MESNDPRKLIRVTLREEFVVLTGDLIGALLLQQALYWTESHKEYDDFLREEERRRDTGIGQTYGWFRKSIRQITDQTLLKSKSSVADHLQVLIDAGWLESRPDPHEKDRLQYRIKLVELQRDLQAHGFPLDGYTLISGKGGMTGGKACPSDGRGVRHTDRVSVTRTAISEEVMKVMKSDEDVDVDVEKAASSSLCESGELVRQGTFFCGDIAGLTAEVFKQVQVTAPQVRSEDFLKAFPDLLREQAVWSNAHHVRRTPKETYDFHKARFLKRYRSKRLLFYDLNYSAICQHCGIQSSRILDDRRACDQEERVVSALSNKLGSAGTDLRQYVAWLLEKAVDKGWTLTPALILKQDLVNEYLASLTKGLDL